MIGDAARDVEAGKSAGCRAILLCDRTLPASPAAKSLSRIPPDFIASSLSEAMDHIAASAASDAAQPPAAEVVSPVPDAPAEASIATSLARIPRAAGDEPSPQQSSGPSPNAPSDAGPVPSPQLSSAKLENLAEQILHEIRHGREVQHSDFSVSKLLAGIVQVIAVSVAFLAYLNRDSTGLESILLLAIFLQAMTCSLLIMSRQK